MTSLVHNMTLNDCAITIEFDWYGDDEPHWDTMVVSAALPDALIPEMFSVVKVNDLLSDGDWVKITQELYWNEREIRTEKDWL